MSYLKFLHNSFLFKAAYETLAKMRYLWTLQIGLIHGLQVNSRANKVTFWLATLVYTARSKKKLILF